MKSNFRYSLDNFRGLAIIFVMFSHVFSFRELGKIADYYYYFLVDATSWFVFISGYLFYYLEERKFNYKDYLVKKFKYVILPYLIIAIPIILCWIYLSQHILYGLSAWKYMLWSLIVGGVIVPPLWFIPMIFIFFLLTPLSRKLAKTNYIYWVTALALIFGMFSSRPIHNMNPFLSFMHFMGAYFFGIVVAKNAKLIDEIRFSTKTKIIFVSLFLFLIFGFLFPGVDSMTDGFFDGLWHLNYIIVGKFFLLIAIFFIFERYFQKENKIFGYFAKISFGLFFIHGIMCAVFRRITRDVIFSNAYSKLFTEICVVVIASIVIVYILKKILKKWSRYVIGC